MVRWSITKHKYYVFLAGLKLGVPFWRLLVHDLSKYGKERKGYARWFSGDHSRPEEFDEAWLHHQNHNDHHPEYWITRSGHTLSAKVFKPAPLQMPYVCVLEMVADWMGASKAYTGSWDMSEWLNSSVQVHIDRMHPYSVADLYVILARTGHVYHDRWINYF